MILYNYSKGKENPKNQKGNDIMKVLMRTASLWEYVEYKTVKKTEFFQFLQGLYKEYGERIIVDLEGCEDFDYDAKIIIYDDYLE